MTPNDIQNKRFDKGMSGYKTEEVNAYLMEVAACVKELQEEKQDLEKKMIVLAEKLEEYREDEDSLRAALIGAQKLGDSVVKDAKKKAEILLAEATLKAEELVSDAKGSIDKEAISLARMQGEVAEFKNQILSMYKRHIEIIQSIPYDTPASPKRETAREHKRETPPVEESAVRSEGEKISEFVLKYDDTDAEEDEETAESGGKHKRSSYGNLRFGEEYNLTRKD